MNIYVSHITPRHNREGSDAKSALGIPPDVKVAVSADFASTRGSTGNGDAGAKWPSRDAALMDADAFVVLLPPTAAEELAESFSIGVELGSYLEICNRHPREPLVFCLHHPDMDPVAIERQCPVSVRTVPATDASLQDFVRTVCGVQGGAAGENQKRTGMITTGLLVATDALGPSERYTTATTLNLSIFEKDLPQLGEGKIPNDTAVGGFEWEKTVGLPKHTAGLVWAEFRQCLQDADMQERILAEELAYVRKNLRQRNLVPILLREEAQQMPSAAVVQKYDVFPGIIFNQKGEPVSAPQHRFSLVAFQSPLLFRPDDRSLVSSAYHLLVVAQLFRFSVVDTDLRELQTVFRLSEHRKELPEFESKKRLAIANVTRHMLLIDVECRRRGFIDRVADFDRIVLEAFGLGETPGAEETPLEKSARQNQARLSEIMTRKGWAEAREEFFKDLSDADNSLKEAIEALKKLMGMNADVLRITSEAYAKLAAKEYQTLKSE